MREPTEDEIERARAAGYGGTGREIIRTMLRAAFNPTQEPEIEVTDEMMDAGKKAYHNTSLTKNMISDHFHIEGLVNAYRAMHGARPKTMKTYWCKHDWREGYVQYQLKGMVRAMDKSVTVHYCVICGQTEKI